MRPRAESEALSVEERVPVYGLLEKLLDALEYLHGKQVLHRDIKPSNILLDKQHNPHLIGFATANRKLGAYLQKVVESPGYTPLEQLQSGGNEGAWTDIHALGATFFKLVTGETPQRSTDRLTTRLLPLSERPELCAVYSPALLRSIDKAMAFWPEERWQSVAEWKAALASPEEAALALPEATLPRDVVRAADAEGPQAPAAPVAAARAPHPFDERWRLMSCAALALLLVLGCVSIWYATRMASNAQESMQRLAAERSLLEREGARLGTELRLADSERRQLALESGQLAEARSLLEEELHQTRVAKQRLEQEIRMNNTARTNLEAENRRVAEIRRQQTEQWAGIVAAEKQLRTESARLQEARENLSAEQRAMEEARRRLEQERGEMEALRERLSQEADKPTQAEPQSEPAPAEGEAADAEAAAQPEPQP